MTYHCFQRNNIVFLLAVHPSLWFNRRRLEVTVIEVTTIPMLQQFRLKTCIHYSGQTTFRTRTRNGHRREIWVSVYQLNNSLQHSGTVILPINNSQRPFFFPSSLLCNILLLHNSVYYSSLFILALSETCHIFNLTFVFFSPSAILYCFHALDVSPLMFCIWPIPSQPGLL